jgi:hypothetical protein
MAIAQPHGQRLWRKMRATALASGALGRLPHGPRLREAACLTMRSIELPCTVIALNVRAELELDASSRRPL